MIKRLAIIAAIAITLIPAPVSADLDGTRRQLRDDRLCGRMGAAYERNGLTVRERAKLERRECKKVGGVWKSGRFYAA